MTDELLKRITRDAIPKKLARWSFLSVAPLVEESQETLRSIVGCVQGNRQSLVWAPEDELVPALMSDDEADRFLAGSVDDGSRRLLSYGAT